jgi:hypothetical protein
LSAHVPSGHLLKPGGQVSRLPQWKYDKALSPPGQITSYCLDSFSTNFSSILFFDAVFYIGLEHFYLQLPSLHLANPTGQAYPLVQSVDNFLQEKSGHLTNPSSHFGGYLHYISLNTQTLSGHNNISG